VNADFSSSMMQGALWKPTDNVGQAEPFKGSTRIDVAKYELKRIIRQLPNGTRLNVIAFWNFLGLYDEKQAVGLDESIRKKMCKWVDATPPDSGTSIWDAFRRAFEMGGGAWNDKLKSDSLDTIVLMTDGEPTGRVCTKKLMLEKLREINRFRRVAIHCIGVECPTNGEDLLKAIAGENWGTYQKR
jgi:hypothetical protein